MSPLVSVITSFYNPGEHLEEAIRSVAGQTLRDWELLLVDDGSSDAGTSIARTWADRRPEQVRYLEHPSHANRGQGASRNVGVAEARGRYVAFLDADDVYLPERLARHVEILERFAAVDAVQSDQAYWYWWRDRRDRVHQELCHRPPLFLGDAFVRAPEGVALLLGVPDYFVGTCSITLRRSAMLSVGGFEDEFRSVYEDQVFLTKIYASCEVYWMQSCLAWYRLHGAGALATAVAAGHSAGMTLREASRRLRAWQSQYLAGRLEAHSLVDSLLAEVNESLAGRNGGQLEPLRQRVRYALHMLARHCLPDSRYRAMLRLRQSRAARRTRADHQRLCDRAALLRMQRSREG